MHDLTRGPILPHLIRMAVPIGIGMLFQTLYYLVDLYFVSRLGDVAIAGVSAGGNAQFLVLAATQVLGVGAMALIAQACGRGDRDEAGLVFNQSLVLALAAAAATLLGGSVLLGAYVDRIAADAGTAAAARAYLLAFLPGMALQFPLVAVSSALRGSGLAKPGMVVQMLTVLLNALLAPVLITGWLTGRPLGAAGAGLATSLSIAAGVLMLWLYFARYDTYVRFDRRRLAPRLAVLRRILAIGLPPGGEFALMFVYLGTIYAILGHVGAAAQAGFGIGSRVMQAVFLPAMALAFATAPVAGQNVGAGHHDRVRRVFFVAAWLGSAVMVVLTVLCRWRPELLVAGFTDDPAVLAVATEFLRFVALNFVASGLVFTCSGMFQALGNTLPALASSASRLLTFVLPALWLAHRPGFALAELWTLSVASVALQAGLSVGLLLWRLRRPALRPMIQAG